MVAINLDQEKKDVDAVGMQNCVYEKLPAVKAEEPETRNVRRHTVLPQLTSFLLCLSVRTGTQIIGWFWAVPSLMSTVYIASGLLYSIIWLADKNRLTDEDTARLGILVCCLIFVLVPAIVSIRLLIGVHKRKAEYLQSFMVIQCIDIILSMFLVLTLMNRRYTGYMDRDNRYYLDTMHRNFTSIFFVFTMKIYAFLIVNSHHTELQNQSLSHISSV